MECPGHDRPRLRVKSDEKTGFMMDSLKHDFRLNIKVIGTVGWGISRYVRLVFDERTFYEMLITGIDGKVWRGVPLHAELDILSKKCS